MLKQGDDLVAALDAVRAEEDRLGASRITSCGPGTFCSHRSAKTPNPDDPTPIFVRGRESTCVTFVLENPEARTAFIFAMEQSWSGFPPPSIQVCLAGPSFASARLGPVFGHLKH